MPRVTSPVRGSLSSDANPYPTDRAEEMDMRIRGHSEGLLQLHDSLDQERNFRFDALQKKLELLNQRLLASQDYGGKNFSELKTYIGKVKQDFASARAAREELSKRRSAEISALSASLKAALAVQQDRLKESEAKVLRLFMHKTASVQKDCGSHFTGANDATLSRFLNDDVPKLYQSLEAETQEREAMEERMMARAMAEVRELQGAILAEKKAREDSEEAMLRMMEDVVTKMQAEVAEERTQRERTEEMLRSLMDATCHKLHVASMSL